MKDQKYISKIKNIFQLLFLSLIVTFSFLTFIPKASVYSQDLTPAQTASETAVNYQLPYPGLLPDHPLYFLKAARDRVFSFFISNPLKKAEFNLLQADKRVEASYMLSKKGEEKIDLAQSTFSKAENYFEDAVNRAYDAKTQGMNTIELSKKLTDANHKHQQVLNDLTKSINSQDRKKFTKERARLVDFEKRVKELAR